MGGNGPFWDVFLNPYPLPSTLQSTVGIYCIPIFTVLPLLQVKPESESEDVEHIFDLKGGGFGSDCSPFSR